MQPPIDDSQTAGQFAKLIPVRATDNVQVD